jgi:hypothetical protein
MNTADALANYLGSLLRGPNILPCLVLIVQLVASPKIMAIKAGVSIDGPTCLVCPPALLVGLLGLFPAVSVVEVNILPTNMPRAIYFIKVSVVD